MRGAIGVTDRCCSTPGGWRGRRNQKNTHVTYFYAKLSHLMQNKVKFGAFFNNCLGPAFRSHIAIVLGILGPLERVTLFRLFKDYILRLLKVNISHSGRVWTSVFMSYQLFSSRGVWLNRKMLLINLSFGASASEFHGKLWCITKLSQKICWYLSLNFFENLPPVFLSC